MKQPREYWNAWAEILRRYRLDRLALTFLEAGAPLALLGAQFLHFSRGLVPRDKLAALALTLEEEKEMRAFASFLAQEEKASS
jgi:hypothetical protein